MILSGLPRPETELMPAGRHHSQQWITVFGGQLCERVPIATGRDGNPLKEIEAGLWRANHERLLSGMARDRSRVGPSELKMVVFGAGFSPPCPLSTDLMLIALLRIAQEFDAALAGAQGVMAAFMLGFAVAHLSAALRITLGAVPSRSSGSPRLPSAR